MILKFFKAIRIPKEKVNVPDDLYLLLEYVSFNEAFAPNGRVYNPFIWVSQIHVPGKPFLTMHEFTDFMQARPWTRLFYQDEKWDDIPEVMYTSMARQALLEAVTIEEMGGIILDGIRASTSSDFHLDCLNLSNRKELFFDRGEYNAISTNVYLLNSDFFVIKTSNGKYARDPESFPFNGEFDAKASQYIPEDAEFLVDCVSNATQFSTEDSALTMADKRQLLLGDDGYVIERIKGLDWKDSLSILRDFELNKKTYLKYS